MATSAEVEQLAAAASGYSDKTATAIAALALAVVYLADKLAVKS